MKRLCLAVKNKVVRQKVAMTHFLCKQIHHHLQLLQAVLWELGTSSGNRWPRSGMITTKVTLFWNGRIMYVSKNSTCIRKSLRRSALRELLRSSASGSSYNDLKLSIPKWYDVSSQFGTSCSTVLTHSSSSVGRNALRSSRWDSANSDRSFRCIFLWRSLSNFNSSSKLRWKTIARVPFLTIPEWFQYLCFQMFYRNIPIGQLRSFFSTSYGNSWGFHPSSRTELIDMLSTLTG